MSLPEAFASSMHICSKRFSKAGGVRGEPDKRRAAVLLCKPLLDMNVSTCVINANHPGRMLERLSRIHEAVLLRLQPRRYPVRQVRKGVAW